jgi:hypothetical protein
MIGYRQNAAHRIQNHLEHGFWAETCSNHIRHRLRSKINAKIHDTKKGIVADLGSRDIRDLGFSSRLPFGGSIWTDGVSE